MKPRFSNQRIHALTLVEVLVVIVVLAVIAAILLPALSAAKRKASHFSCHMNLQMIDLANQIFAGDHNGKFPIQVSLTNGGAMELIVTGNVAAYFQVMSNELSTPKLLICPADTDRIAATNFITDFNSSKISYFVGLGANTNSPQAFLSGDDNFAIGSVPVKSGLLELSTNVEISWTAARHKFVGNIGLADGSVQQTTQDELRQALQQTGLATNRLAIP
jgi:prepilin-type N-terminal cleavage/methylation domain-containing protein